ncbi:MAG: hypothetical protein AABZ08_08700 [Planctomycetota bacterium]
MNAFRNMKTLRTIVMMSVMMSVAQLVMAGEATSNATATGNAFGPGTAAATAGYIGDGRGYARTDTRTGAVNFASGMSIGVDNRGVCFSASNALAGRFGPAIASNLNICIGRDGSVASSGGLSTAQGGLARTVSAGGFARTNLGGALAGSTVGGRTDRGGTVTGRTWSDSMPPNFRGR